MAKRVQPIIKINEILHVGFVVRDMDKSMEAIWNTFGIGPWNAGTRNPDSTSEEESITDETYYGKPVRFAANFAYANVGSLQIGLEAPVVVEGEGIFSEFIRAHGEGVQHLRAYVMDTLEAFNELKRKMEKAGFPCAMSIRSYPGATAYYDTEKVLHSLLEVNWLRTSGRGVGTTRVFPPKAKTANPVIKITDLYQIGMVVRNLNKTMEAMWNTFGIGPWEVFIREPDAPREEDRVTDQTHYGKPTRFSFNFATTQLGDIQIELIQPIKGDNIYSDFLIEHGEGIQHLGHHRVDSLNALAELKQKLAKAGFPCIMSGRTYLADVAYFDTTKVLHTILEASWRHPLTTKPQPVRVFPS